MSGFDPEDMTRPGMMFAEGGEPTEEEPEDETAADDFETETEAMLATQMKARLTDYIIDKYKERRKPWQELDEIEQKLLISNVSYESGAIVQEAVELLVEHEFPSVAGTLESVASKDGIKVVVKIGRGAKARYELLDRVGQEVQVVMADAEVFGQDPHETKAEPTQPELVYNEGASGDTQEDLSVTDAEQKPDADSEVR